MPLKPHQISELIRRAYKIAEISVEIAMVRSYEDCARSNLRLEWNEEFDKTTLMAEGLTYVKNYLFLCQHYPLTEAHASKLYNYAFQTAVTTLAANITNEECFDTTKITFQDFQLAYQRALQQPDLLATCDNKIVDHDYEKRSACGEFDTSNSAQLCQITYEIAKIDAKLEISDSELDHSYSDGMGEQTSFNRDHLGYKRVRFFSQYSDLCDTSYTLSPQKASALYLNAFNDAVSSDVDDVCSRKRYIDDFRIDRKSLNHAIMHELSNALSTTYVALYAFSSIIRNPTNQGLPSDLVRFIGSFLIPEEATKSIVEFAEERSLRT